MNPVEIDVSGRCKHECFTIGASTPLVWRFQGMHAFHSEPDAVTVIHRHDPDEVDECSDECFPGQEDVDAR